MGVSGFTLGGGHGLLVRKWGMAVDSLIEVEIILANRTIVIANEN